MTTLSRRISPRERSSARFVVLARHRLQDAFIESNLTQIEVNVAGKPVLPCAKSVIV
jgi:hypothetical protein